MKSIPKPNILPLINIILIGYKSRLDHIIIGIIYLC